MVDHHVKRFEVDHISVTSRWFSQLSQDQTAGQRNVSLMEKKMKKYDVVALGELLIDFTENGKSNQGNPLFEANPGGAPCNVLAMLTKLGHKTSFIGKVGEDFYRRIRIIHR